MEGFSEMTDEQIESMNKCTSMLQDVMIQMVTKVQGEGEDLMAMQEVFDGMKDFLIVIGARGIMTMLGFRATTGS